MPYYNMTNTTTSSNLLGMMQEVNKLSDYILGFMILIAFFVIVVMALKNFGLRTVIPIATFLTTLIGIFLVVMNILPDFMVYVLILLLGGSVVASIFINPEG